MNKRFIFPLLTLVAMLFAGCKHDTATFSFTATAESPYSSEEKVYMVDEKWIYFEEGDNISISSNLARSSQYNELSTYELGQGETYNGIFHTELDDESTEFIALFPYQSGNEIKVSSNSVKCVFPNEQPFRTDAPVDGDFTFGKDCCPMVAWKKNAPYELRFHSLCGFVRIELSSTAASKYITSIQFTSGDSKNIAGTFTVNDYKQYAPYVTGGTSKEVSITCNRRIGGGNLLTFYLVLPAEQNDVSYKLTMKVTASDNTTSKINMTVPVRRNAITKMRALNISTWGSAPDPQLVGDGSQLRPFQIYTQKDLVLLREAFNTSGTVTINGKTVDNNTYFRLMRSDIVLDNTWTGGIKNFKGKFSYNGNPTDKSITNNSAYPLFESIASGAQVSDIKMAHGEGVKLAKHSPFCETNSGTISACNILSSASEYGTANSENRLAGICYTNNSTGKIIGCGNQGSFATEDGRGNIAGICYTNSGEVSQCNVSTPFSAEAANVGGIVFNNQKTVTDCYYSANVSSSTANWGGIAYNQSTSGATITNCRVAPSGTISTTNSCGGIVNTISNGTVDYCTNEARTLYTKDFGGIACYQNGGTIKNCYCNMQSEQAFIVNVAGGFGGGLVGKMTAGTLHNSFARCQVSTTVGYVGIVVGSISGGTISNSYGWQDPSGQKFFAQKTGGTISNCHNYKQTTTGVNRFSDGSAILSSLNSNRSGAREWVLNSGQPILKN